MQLLKPTENDTVIPLWDESPNRRTAAKLIARSGCMGTYDQPARSTLSGWMQRGRGVRKDDGSWIFVKLPAFRDGRRYFTTVEAVRDFIKAMQE